MGPKLNSNPILIFFHIKLICEIFPKDQTLYRDCSI